MSRGIMLGDICTVVNSGRRRYYYGEILDLHCSVHPDHHMILL